MSLHAGIEELFRETARKTQGEWGILFKDLATGVQVSHNPDNVFASASLIKLPILVGVMGAVSLGKIDLSSRLEVEHSEVPDEEEGSGVIIRLSNPTSLTVHDLCVLMIVVSDNYATNILLDLVETSYINSFLHELGLKCTQVNHKITDYECLRDRSVNPISPAEVSLLLEKIYFRQLPMSETMETILKNQIYGTRLPLLFPYEEKNIEIAHKTGTLTSVAHDAGIFRTPRGDYILTVLTQQQQAISRTNMAIAELSIRVYDRLI